MKSGISFEREQFATGGEAAASPRRAGFPAPPLFVLQPLLGRLVRHVARREPDLFSRLGASAGRRFLIDPVNLPFVLLLEPDPAAPRLTAHRRTALPAHDAAIAGSFLHLFDMVDGGLDGDALFFSRDLQVSGDTEAVVALRNALDDIDGSILDAGAAAFGPLSPAINFGVALMRALSRRARHGDQ
jgi:predicted lipid carrier protein YhbT